MENKKDRGKRRPYVKPEIKKVNLDSTVLLAKGCKFSTVSKGKSGYNCNSSGSCRASGSGS